MEVTQKTSCTRLNNSNNQWNFFTIKEVITLFTIQWPNYYCICMTPKSVTYWKSKTTVKSDDKSHLDFIVGVACNIFKICNRILAKNKYFRMSIQL